MRNRRALERGGEVGFKRHAPSRRQNTPSPGENIGGLASMFSAGELGFLYFPAITTSVSQDAGGATPVAANDDPVGRFADMSGRGNHCTTATSTLRPLWKANSGKPYLNFDGTDDNLLNSFNTTDAGTLAAAFNGTTSSRTAIAGGGGITGSRRCRLALGAAGVASFDFNTAGQVVGAVDLRSTDHVLAMTWGGGVLRCYVDGALLEEKAVVSNHNGTGSGGALGSNEGGGSGFWVGRVYAGLMRGVMSTPEQMALIYLQLRTSYS
jgi:hypothetical protein